MKKGFTLVELLAVIVILAVIAVIAVPQIMKIINQSKIDAFRASVRNAYAAAKVEVAKGETSGTIKELGISGEITGYWSYSKDNKTIKLCNVYKDGYVISSSCLINREAKETFAVTKATVTKDNPNVNLITENLDKSGANKPDLSSGMIPVRYDENKWVKADVSNSDSNNKWYDYTNKQWANAVTVVATGSGNGSDGVTRHNRDYYVESPAGTAISMDDINTMWVWIPKYKYAVPSGNGAREIAVVFENGLAKTGIGTTSPSGVDLATLKGNSNHEKYITHPAFTFGRDEVAGIWVGKFETSHSTLASSTTNNNLGCSNEACSNANGIIIKPNVQSLRYNNILNTYYVSRSMGQINNSFGFSSDSDTHMMKNTEWGAVAYLSQSIYGKYGNNDYSTNVNGVNQKEIYINNSSGYYTGISGGRPGYDSEYIVTDGCFAYDGTIKNNNPACNSNGDFSLASGESVESKLNSARLSLAYGASTTGTIYGIYDMSGGAWESVMGVYKPATLSTPSGIKDCSGYSSSYATTCSNGGPYESQYEKLTINSKYYNQYTSGTGYKGDGTNADGTSGWYADDASFVYSDSPWSYRGGARGGSAFYAGVFCSSRGSGVASSNYSFRVVLLKP